MRSEDLRMGLRVSVSCVRRGSGVGRITAVYGDPAYRAAEVRLGPGRSELFWHHELERAPEASIGPADGNHKPDVPPTPEAATYDGPDQTPL